MLTIKTEASHIAASVSSRKNESRRMKDEAGKKNIDMGI